MFDVIFLIDCLLINFNTAVYTEAHGLSMDRCVIAREYLSFWFWIDFAAVIPITFILSIALEDSSTEDNSSSRLARLLRLTRLPRLLRLFKFVRMPLALTFDPNVYRLLRLILSLFIV